MAGLLSDYLSTKTADNDYTLNITPKGSIRFSGNGLVEILKGDDGKSEVRVSPGGDPEIFATILLSYLSDTDAQTVIDCYFSSSKGAKGLKTFKWYNPKDTSTYIVRFETQQLAWEELQRTDLATFDRFTLAILGNA